MSGGNTKKASDSNNDNCKNIKNSFLKSKSSNFSMNLSCELSHTCSVCAETDPKFWSVASGCGHKICWMCSLRLRALYGSKACPICKTESEFVYICKRAEDASPRQNKVNFNDLLSVSYENEVTRTACETLLLLKCPFNHALSGGGNRGPACEKVFQVKKDLRRHVQSVHDLEICDICLEHKKCFSVELPLYNRSSLLKHQREANHPRCQVCDAIFYSEDELNEHCRDAHELCHICQRNGRPNRHFLNYTRLEEHFKKDHFLCPEPLCRELKFVVFSSELEYKAHQAEVHLSHQKLQRSQQRQLQRLNINFGHGNANDIATINSSNSGNTNSSGGHNSNPLKLTTDQRNQIAANLVFGELTDDLANRLQSLSLYQNRNDQFVETLRGAYQLSQAQIQSIISEAREFQKGNSSATQLVAKVESILGDCGGSEDVYKICEALSELQLDPEKQQRFFVALGQFKEKCLAFPELLSSASKSKSAPSSKKVWVSNSFSKGSKAVSDEKSASFDPFSFARSSLNDNNNKQSILNDSSSSSQRQFKVLQIVKPSTSIPSNTSKSTDPSKNPALLLSQLAGGPAYRSNSNSTNNNNKKSISIPSNKTKPAKVTSFSAAALGGGNNSLNFAVSSSKSKSVFDEREFPSLSKNASNNASAQDNVVEDSIMNINSPSSTSFTSKSIANNAFFAPNDRDQLESFTIGDDESRGESELTDGGKKSGKKGSKKVVFRYGQKWDL